MTTTTNISINFDGYYLEGSRYLLPDKRGIYIIQSCSHNKKMVSIQIKSILYIGHAPDVRSAVLNHEKWDEMKRFAHESELCVNVASFNGSELMRAAAALTYKHKPIFNDENVMRFEYDTTTIHMTGRYRALIPLFTVYPTHFISKA